MNGQERRIVVGVDGSEPSKLALRWAIRQAKLTGGSVDAVIAWRYPSTCGWAPYPDGLPDLADMAKRTLIAALAKVSGLEPDVLVRPVVTEGHAAGALLDAARGAGLLVVGSRGTAGSPRRCSGGQHAVRAARALSRPGVPGRDTSRGRRRTVTAHRGTSWHRFRDERP
jgi:nucleotide-binding universal stress UspA family protein